MRKSLFLAAAGAGLLLTGCHKDIMGDHHYRTIPVDEAPPPYVGETAVPPAATASTSDVRQPQPIAEKPVARPQYQPMTGAVSTGGVDSAPAGKKGGKAGKNGAVVSAEAGTYVVQPGDTLDRIARRHGVRLSALMKANNLDDASSRKLHVGRKLVIPEKSSDKAAVKAPGAAKNGPAAAEAENGKYRVKTGDSAERIARRYRVKVSELLKANNLDEASARRLQVGQELVIPGKAAPVVSAAPAAGKSAPAAVAQQDVKSSTAKPAVPAPTPAAETGKSDDLDNPAPSAVGGEASLAFKEVPADMTFAEFAASCGLTEEQLRTINGGTTQQTVKQGDYLFVPKK